MPLRNKYEVSIHNNMKSEPEWWKFIYCFILLNFVAIVRWEKQTYVSNLKKKKKSDQLSRRRI